MSNIKRQISNVKPCQGFTLIELLVVISIMALLGVVSFAKYATLKEDQNLKAAANELQSLIRVAQTNAISRVKCAGSTSTSGVTWLVEFRTDQKNIDLKCYTSDPLVTTTPKTLTLTSVQPVIDSIKGQDTCTSSYPSSNPNEVIDLSFAPLYGTITFTDKSSTAPPCFATSNQVSITLKNPSSTTTKSLIITKGGSIEIR